MVKIYDQEEIAGINIIASGTTFQGNIINSGDCRIDGIVKGNINSSSKVIIGKTGVVEGEIICKSIEIEGTAKTNIVATDLLSLKSSAVLNGNIKVDKIAIEPGAKFNGNCIMQNDGHRAPNPTIVDRPADSK